MCKIERNGVVCCCGCTRLPLQILVPLMLVCDVPCGLRIWAYMFILRPASTMVSRGTRGRVGSAYLVAADLVALCSSVRTGAHAVVQGGGRDRQRHRSGSPIHSRSSVEESLAPSSPLLGREYRWPTGPARLSTARPDKGTTR